MREEKHPVIKNNELILGKINSLLSRYRQQIKVIGILKQQINELEHNAVDRECGRDIDIKQKQLSTLLGVIRPALSKTRQLANDFSVKLCLPINKNNLEFHDGYIVCVLSENQVTYNFIDEFGKKTEFEFVKGKAVTIESNHSAWYLNDYKNEILEMYGKDTLWVWIKRDCSAVLDRNRFDNVIKDGFNEYRKDSYVIQVDENLYDILPAAIINVGDNLYIKYLNDMQSKSHKVLSFDEIRIVNNKPLAEKSYLFTLPFDDDYCKLVWENTNEKRATLAFITTTKASYIALGAIYKYATSNMRNKRQLIIQKVDELRHRFGLNSHYRIVHSTFDTWKRGLISSLPTYYNV